MKKVQTLTEEIQKMRKLMSFNINENSHDSLSEENFKNSTEGKNIDPKQEECAQVYGGPSEVAHKMSNELNLLLEKGLDNIKKQTKVTIVAKGAGELYFEIGDIRLSLGLDPESERLGYGPLYMFASKGGNITFATDLPVSLFKEELLNSDKCFRLLYDRYESIRNQIDGEKISMKLVSSGYEGEGNIGVKMFIENSSRQLKKGFKKGTSRFVDFNNANLFDFDKPFYIKLNKVVFGRIESVWGVKLTRISLDGADVPNEWGEPDSDPNKDKCYCNDVDTGEKVEYPCGGELPERCKDDGEPVVFDFVVEANKNFEFDDAVLTQEAKDKIDSEIVEKWNKIPQNRKEGYLEFLKGKTINVNAYSSIDALSNFPDGGRYAGCSKYGVGKGPRVEYNLCLSQARAEAVVEYLKTIAEGVFKDVNFVAVGKGETNQFSGLKWDSEAKPKIVKGVPVNVKSPYSTDQTKSDRRFEVKFPKWHTED
jgi:outer membrane protein OmpA-like peptidoglycan-associated protein